MNVTKPVLSQTSTIHVESVYNNNVIANYMHRQLLDDMGNNNVVCGRNLKILNLNVCGLKSKLDTPEFMETCEKYDIVCLTETKLDDFDTELVCKAFKYHWSKCIFLK